MSGKRWPRNTNRVRPVIEPAPPDLLGAQKENDERLKALENDQRRLKHDEGFALNPGQQQPRVIQAAALITPDLERKLKEWCDKIGLPDTEVSNTIFRLGLIAFSAVALDNNFTTETEVHELMPLTPNEEKAFGKTPPPQQH